MAETTAEKAKRLLVEGRVVVVRADREQIAATVRGDGRIYDTGFRGEWSCSCPTPSPTCSHIRALKLITAVDVVHLGE